ncbi:protein of unknown function [Pseudogulbenkiania sp. NH8B]|nr:protein of unknown function [Pseudogulbenkiania sp. NH8B]
MLSKFGIADDSWNELLLNYTAGHPILTLRDQLETVIQAIETYTAALREWHNDPVYPPFLLGDLDHYEQLMQLIGLCYLLHRQDLLPRLAALQDGWFAGEDTLYEDLIGYALPDRYDVDHWHHCDAYRDIVNSAYGDAPVERLADLSQYVKRWYKTSMKGLPWHNTHLEPNQAGYYGYWCFEAGAVAFLQGLDDSKLREFPYYPKDMVDWARNFQPDSPELKLGRCEAGQPCPQAGTWWTPAKPDAHRHFSLGEIMPAFPDSTYGATIWYREAE